MVENEMKSFLVLAALAVLVTTSVALANATDDGNAGLDALNSGAYDKAITLFTRAIKSGELAGDDKEFAYLNRGKAYLGKQDYKDALPDLREALRLNPDDADAQGSLNLALSKSTSGGAARPIVGTLLQQAIDFAQAGNTNGATAKLHEAEATDGLTAGDQRAIRQVDSFIAAKSGKGSTGTKAKFAEDYSAGRYNDVVGPDAEELRKLSEYDAQSQLVVAHAYYLMGDFRDAESVTRQIIDAATANGGTPDQQLRDFLNACLSKQGKNPE